MGLLLDLTTGVFHDSNCPLLKNEDLEDKRWVNEFTVRKGYTPCRRCCRMYSKFLKDNRLAKRLEDRGYKYGFSGNWMYIQSDVAYWKIYFDISGRYVLYHGNNRPKKNGEVKKPDYHRQSDVPYYQSLNEFLTYIFNHDEYIRTGSFDLNKLPRSTKNQKKFKNRVRNRIKNCERKRVYRKLDQLTKQRLEEEKKVEADGIAV